MNYKIILRCLFIVVLISCDKENIVTENNSPIKFNGIAQTDHKGELISDDVNDWQPRVIADSSGGIKILPKYVCFKPAYPNPTDRFTVLQYGFPRRASVTIEIFSDEATKISTVIANDTLSAGYYQYYFDFGDSTRKYTPGIYRCFFEIRDLDSNKVYKSFGDIELKKLF